MNSVKLHLQPFFLHHKLQPNFTMPRPSNTAKPSFTNTYLVLYNVLSAILRAFVLVRAVQIWSIRGNAAVWDELNLLARWIETLTVLEIVHAATGLVRASPATTALQVAGRNTIIWAITRNYPDVAAREWAYSSMLVAWNTADVVRYTYFAIAKGAGRVPGGLLWLRYEFFSSQDTTHLTIQIQHVHHALPNWYPFRSLASLRGDWTLSSQKPNVSVSSLVWVSHLCAW